MGAVPTINVISSAFEIDIHFSEESEVVFAASRSPISGILAEHLHIFAGHHLVGGFNAIIISMASDRYYCLVLIKPRNTKR